MFRDRRGTREQEGVRAYQEGKVGCKRQTYDAGRMKLPKLQPSWSLGKQMQNCNIKPETRQSQETWGFWRKLMSPEMMDSQKLLCECGDHVCLSTKGQKKYIFYNILIILRQRSNHCMEQTE